MRLLFFAGSTREGSYNRKLASLAHHIAEANGIEAVLVDLKDYPMPIYNGDLEAKNGPPERARAFKALLGEYRGVFIASPEYNSSVTPLLKNTLDWVSRVRRLDGHAFQPFAGKVAALCSSSDGNFAGIRCLYHLRAVLMACRVEVITPQCSVARAAEAFDESGRFREERLRHQMETVCRTLIERAMMFSTRPET